MTPPRQNIIEDEVRAHLGNAVNVEDLDMERVEHMARDIVRRLNEKKREEKTKEPES